MRKLEEPKRKQWTPVFGAEWVQRWTYPNTVVASGEQMTFDGVTYWSSTSARAATRKANSVWFIETPKRTAFLRAISAFNGTIPT